MRSEFLSNLRNNNQFPIIFIGSGVTQRYFTNAPTWDKLLQMIWSKASEASDDKKSSYYSRFSELQEKGKNDFDIYTTIANELRQSFDRDFFKGNIELPNLTPEKAHNEKVSPFKAEVAEIFSSLIPDQEKSNELKLFKSMLAKARLIVTTNYDEFIEEQLNRAIKVRVGSKGLFEPAGDLNELYKIHGSAKDPNSIIITGEDYGKIERTSAIVNAKILSYLTEAPILFIGYSLTDENVQSLLKDLADNMPFSIERAAKRIGVVQYVKDKQDVDESLRETAFGVYYTELATDNYSKIYSAVSAVDQGISPAEISKYQNAFRQIIDVRGQKGELKQVLTSFVNLDKLPQELKNKNLVVALGDNRYLYKYPDYVDYVKSYFLNGDNMPEEIALGFILGMSPQSTLPVSKYVCGGHLKINDEQKKKLNKRLGKFNDLKALQENVSVSKKALKVLKKYGDMSPEAILEKNDGIKSRVKLDYFIQHINSIDAKKLIEYILKNKNDLYIKETACRKLFMAYSLLTEPIIKEIE